MTCNRIMDTEYVFCLFKKKNTRPQCWIFWAVLNLASIEPALIKKPAILSLQNPSLETVEQ